jgi:adenylate cyclase
VADGEVKRRPAAIIAADVAGYSRLMGDDERATIATLRDYREIFRGFIEANGGRVVDMAGDSVLAVFDSAAGAVQAAVEAQAELGLRNDALDEARRMRFRIGVNLGDIEEADDGTVYGDGVNVAARLEAMADAGGINVSGSVFDSVRSKLGVRFNFLGEHEVKNIADPVRAYSIGDGLTKPKIKSKAKPVPVFAAAAALAILVIAGGAWWLMQPAAEAPSEIDLAVTLPTGPKIAVLPFANPSGDPDEEYFSDGLTGDIINQLTNYPDILVFARNSTNKYKGRDVDAGTVGEELGADYVVEGSVRRDQDELRVTAQVLDAADGTNLWAKTYDRDLTAASLFAVQDEITAGIVNAIGDYAGIIALAEAARATQKAPSSLTSLDCQYLLGAYIDTGLTEERLVRTRDCLERAVADDPEDAGAYIALAENYRLEMIFGFDLVSDELDRGLAAAVRAVELDRNNADAHYMEALLHFNLNEVEAGRVAGENALALSPHDATILADIGSQMGWAGEVERGAAMIEKARIMNPDHPVWYHYLLAHHYRLEGDFDTALEHALQLNWGMQWDFIHRAAIYVEMGLMDDARAEAAKLLEANPDFGKNVRQVFHVWNFPDEAVDTFIDLLRQAGIDFPNELPPTN